MDNFETWVKGSKALLPETVTLRRRIHEQPELGLFLPKTVAAVKESLAGLDVTIEEGPSSSGMIVTLAGPTQGRTVLLRGDMDALPMPEDTDVPFKSKEAGRMHACGHDAHTAMLAGAVKLLHQNRGKLAGTVKFMFQPGEEGHFGALRMIEDGLIGKHPKPDGAFAIHITPNVPSGVFTSREGAFMASADVLNARIVGKGGHASMPHMAVDPMPIACEAVMALQAYVTRRVNAFDPIILTIARISGGTTNNVIPEAVELEGTLRSVSEGARKSAKAGIIHVIQKIAEAHGATAIASFREGYPVTVNDGRMVQLAVDVTQQMFGERGYIASPAPVMGAEDWSYVLQQIPGCMVFLGVAPEGCSHQHAAPCHSNRMMLDENAMANGVAMYAAVAERFLDQGLPAKG